MGTKKNWPPPVPQDRGQTRNREDFCAETQGGGRGGGGKMKFELQ